MSGHEIYIFPQKNGEKLFANHDYLIRCWASDLGYALFANYPFGVLKTKNGLTLLFPLLMVTLSSADNLCKQFRPRSGKTKHWAWSGSKLFDTLRLFLKDFLEKVNFFKKNPQTTKKHAELPSMQRAKASGLGGSVGCAVRLETRRSRVQPPPRSATFFRGDWSWNIFYGHSLPSADSRRAVVSFWRKNVHNTG